MKANGGEGCGNLVFITASPSKGAAAWAEFDETIKLDTATQHLVSMCGLRGIDCDSQKDSLKSKYIYFLSFLNIISSLWMACSGYTCVSVTCEDALCPFSHVLTAAKKAWTPLYLYEKIEISKLSFTVDLKMNSTVIFGGSLSVCHSSPLPLKHCFM